MTLVRDELTPGSKVMLPSYVVFFGALGLNYTLTPAVTSRLNESPTLAYAGSIMPGLGLPGWGILFLLVAALMLAAMVQGKRQNYRYALTFGRYAMWIWTVVFICAAIFGGASPAGWVFPWLAARACLASYRQLGSDEVQ